MSIVLWCPIDLPKCPVIPNLGPSSKRHQYWDFFKLTNKHNNPYAVTNFNDKVVNNYPELIEWFKLFPYKTIRNVKLNYQISKVDQHIDFTKPELDIDLFNNNSDNEPCGYRVLLKGTRKNKLYVIHNNEKIYCDMPDDTDVYVLGHTSTLHGVEDDQDRWTIFTHFEIDSVKHKQLLNKSLHKYSNYAIIRK